MLDLDLNRQVAVQVARHQCIAADFEPIEMRCPAQSLNIGGRYTLKPDALPDAGSARIPDRMRFQLPVLLAAWLGQIVWIVIYAHGDDLVAGVVQCMGNVG